MSTDQKGNQIRESSSPGANKPPSGAWKNGRTLSQAQRERKRAVNRLNRHLQRQKNREDQIAALEIELQRLKGKVDSPVRSVEHGSASDPASSESPSAAGYPFSHSHSPQCPPETPHPLSPEYWQIFEEEEKNAVQKQSEDCLSLNIQRPKDASLRNLPVMVWIHGGGFEAGASSSVISETSVAQGVFYQGSNIIKRSIDMKLPILFVSLNYRLAHFGFTASKEFADAGLLNLGFEDQRNALRWIQKNIDKFGGDPSKVTIMGESAGSWSVAAHLVANGGDNESLFRSAIGMSGGPVKVEGPERQQSLFDDLMKYAGCDKSQNKVQCLREVPFEKIYAHMGSVNYFLEGYRSLASAWKLRPGCKLLPQSPDKLAATGKISNVPLLMGDMRDEGPLFSLITALNTTTDDDVKDYFKTYWWPKATESQLNRLLELYHQDPTKGSPYGTGFANAPTPQFKRIASIVGDYSFEAQRRQFFTQHKGPKRSYQTEVTVPLPLVDDTFLGGLIGKTGLTHIPVLGSFHAFDVLFYLFGTVPYPVSKNSKNIMITWISFVRNTDPNIHDLKNAPHWPQYDTSSKKLYHFQETGLDIITDDYR